MAWHALSGLAGRHACSRALVCGMNKPDDFDCWRLPDDESVQKCGPMNPRRVREAVCSFAACAVSRRVTITPDTKVPNAATLVIEREDHTLGNMLRM